MALPHELRFLGTPKGQLTIIALLLLSAGGYVAFVLATLPAAGKDLALTQVLKLSVTGLPHAPTRKHYGDEGGQVADTFKLPKTPTARLLYFANVSRHSDAYRLVRKARFAALKAGVGLLQFDCSSEKARCDKEYADEDKLERDAKDPKLAYFQDGDHDDTYKFTVADLRSPAALSDLEKWLSQQPKLHPQRKAKRAKEREEEAKKYGGMGGMGGGYPGMGGMGGMEDMYGQGYGYGGMKGEL